MVGNHCRFPTVLCLRTPCDILCNRLYVLNYVLFIFISLFIATTNIRNKNAKVKLFGVLPFTHGLHSLVAHLLYSPFSVYLYVQISFESFQIIVICIIDGRVNL